MSWWWHEQGLDPRNAGQITMEERFRLMRVYWAAVSDGWRPSVPREDWVGSCHPFEGGD